MVFPISYYFLLYNSGVNTRDAHPVNNKKDKTTIIIPIIKILLPRLPLNNGANNIPISTNNILRSCILYARYKYFNSYSVS